VKTTTSNLCFQKQIILKAICLAPFFQVSIVQLRRFKQNVNKNIYTTKGALKGCRQLNIYHPNFDFRFTIEHPQVRALLPKIKGLWFACIEECADEFGSQVFFPRCLEPLFCDDTPRRILTNSLHTANKKMWVYVSGNVRIWKNLKGFEFAI